MTRHSTDSVSLLLFLLAMLCAMPVTGCTANALLSKTRTEAAPRTDREATPPAGEEYRAMRVRQGDGLVKTSAPAGARPGKTADQSTRPDRESKDQNTKPPEREDGIRLAREEKGTPPAPPKEKERPSRNEGREPGSAQGLRPPPDPRESGLMDDFLVGMIAVTPQEFETPIREVPFGMKQVVNSVLQSNRAIQVAAYYPEQARAEIMTAKSVYDPELFGSYNYSQTESPNSISINNITNVDRYRNTVGRAGIRQHMPTGGNITAYREWNHGTERSQGANPVRGHGGAYVVEVTQPILNGFADMENRTVIEISRLQADITDEEFRQTVTETMSKALEAYWLLLQAREDVRINRESLGMAEHLLERELERKDEGISTLLDVNRAREAVATRAYNVKLAQEQFHQAQENLKYLMNDKSVPVGMDIYIDTVEKLETPLARPNMDDSITIALKNRPEMLTIDMEIRQSDLRRRYAKHTLLPELNMVGSLRHNDSGTSTPSANNSTLYTGNDWTVGMEFSMPIGNMKARSNVRKAESQLSQVTEQKKNIRDQVITEVRTLVKNIELVVREIPLNVRARESAVKVIEGEWAKLELNQTGNRDLLQAQDLLSVTERNYVNSFIRYNVYIIRLYAAEGILLDKMGIQLRH